MQMPDLRKGEQQFHIETLNNHQIEPNNIPQTLYRATTDQPLSSDQPLNTEQHLSECGARVWSTTGLHGAGAVIHRRPWPVHRV